jgi:predicted Zn finger-like uncharacterized protein
MRMVCPACSATYEVPESLLTPGRAVRCARCGDEWVPVAPEPPAPEAPARPHWPDSELVEEVEVEPIGQAVPESPRFTAMDRLALHRASTGRSSVPLRIAWTATVLALLLLVAAAYVWRVELMHVWPASQRVYQALGFMQNAAGKP